MGVISGLVYCENDPINFFDCDGRKPEKNETVLEWYMDGMGGLSDWVDKNLMAGSVGGLGDAVGRHDSGNASTTEVVVRGTVVGGLLVLNAVSVTKTCGSIVARGGQMLASRGSGLAIGSYKQLFGLLKGQLLKNGLEVHHLIPRRFAELLGLNIDEIASVVLSSGKNGTHNIFTQAFYKALPYGAKLTKADIPRIMVAVKEIYKDHPALLNAVKLYLLKKCRFDLLRYLL